MVIGEHDQLGTGTLKKRVRERRDSLLAFGQFNTVVVSGDEGLDLFPCEERVDVFPGPERVRLFVCGSGEGAGEGDQDGSELHD